MDGELDFIHYYLEDKSVGTIEELFDDHDDGSMDATRSSALSLANGSKEALSRGSPQRIWFFFCFCSVLSGLDDCYYCSNIIVSLLFMLCAKFSVRLQER